MKQTDFPAWLCYTCGYLMDAASPVHGGDISPKEEDLSLCVNCGALYILRRGVWVPLPDAVRLALPIRAQKMLTHAQEIRAQVVRRDMTKDYPRA